jgi:hypothetical protein
LPQHKKVKHASAGTKRKEENFVVWRRGGSPNLIEEIKSVHRRVKEGQRKRAKKKPPQCFASVQKSKAMGGKCGTSKKAQSLAASSQKATSGSTLKKNSAMSQKH